MRRSGSSSCLLRPKGESLSPKQNFAGSKIVADATSTASLLSNTSTIAPIQVPLVKQPSVTMVTMHRLPTFSAERYWALSEIDQCVNEVYFLRDIHEAIENKDNDDENQCILELPSNFVILYLLWRPQECQTDDNLLDCVINSVSTIQESMRCTSTDTTNPLEIYLVIDKISVQLPLIGGSSSLLEVNHLLETQTAVRSARFIASNPMLRNSLAGISVGVTDQVRAAPGLVEGVLSTLSHGSRERRIARKACPESEGIDKSIISVVALTEDDFIGLDPARETDAAQGIDQSIVRAEWNGQGDHISFASRAHTIWRERTSRLGLHTDIIMDTDLSLFSVEHMSTLFAVTVVILSLAYVWNRLQEQDTLIND